MAKKGKIELSLGKNQDVIVPFKIAWARQPDMSIHEQKVLLRIMELCSAQLRGLRMSDNLRQIEPTAVTYEITMPTSYAFNRNMTPKEIEDTLKVLAGRMFEYKDKNKWWACGYIEHPKVEYGTGMMSFGVYKPFWNVLLNFVSGFREIELNKALMLPTTYSVRFYMLMSGKSVPFHFTIEQLKEWLGIPDTAYRDTKTGKHRLDNLERVVILPAKKALDESCPWTFTYDKTRINPRNPKSPVKTLVFTPVFQPQFRDPELDIATPEFEEPIEKRVYRILKEHFGVPDQVLKMPGHRTNINRWLQLQDAPLDWLRDKYTRIFQAMKQAGSDVDPIRYILGCIKNQGIALDNKIRHGRDYPDRIDDFNIANGITSLWGGAAKKSKKADPRTGVEPPHIRPEDYSDDF